MGMIEAQYEEVWAVDAAFMATRAGGMTPMLCHRQPPQLPDPTAFYTAATADRWVAIGADGTILAVRHTPVAEDDALCLPVPVALVRCAAKRASANERVEFFTIGSDGVGVRVGDMCASISPVNATPIAIPLRGDPIATATATVGDLYWAIGGAGQHPCLPGCDCPWPTMQIGIDEGSVVFKADWRLHGEGLQRCCVPTITSTDSTLVGIASWESLMGLLWDAFRGDHDRGDATVEVTITADHVCFDAWQGEGWTAWVPTELCGARRWAGQVESRLAEVGHSFRPGPDGITIVCPVGYPVEVYLAYCDTWPEQIRISCVVARGIEMTEQLCLEINRLNHDMVGVSIGYDEADSMVIARIDLPCWRHPEIPIEIDRLCREIEDLGPLFGGFFA